MRATSTRRPRRTLRRVRPRLVLYTEPVAAARAASLRYVTDQQPGIRRRRAGKGFTYVGPEGRPLRDHDTLARIRALAIPPAWTDVWICATATGHLQATGRDARGRKQYRYHKRWRGVRDETKYGRMIPFGHALPRIRQRVAADLERPGLPREKVLATVVRLLETTYVRVGNDEYARSNHSYGLTTLRTRHVEVRGGSVQLRFRGKSGALHHISVTDRRLAALVRRLRDLPGQELFQYLDEEGRRQPIDSADVNAYLREIAGEDFTAKDFRTWAGTVLAARELAQALDRNGDGRARSTIVRVVESVAQALGNTPAVCRKSYIHPLVLQAYGEPALRARWAAAARGRNGNGSLRQEERALLRFLENAGDVR